MCVRVYLASEKEIPEVKWNENSPGFHLDKVDPNEYDHLNKILNSQFIYEAGSHMGCSCGFCYAQWSLDDENENHDQRVKDVLDLTDYLKSHKKGNTLQIFCTEWREFPDEYETKKFELTNISKQEFSFEEMVILSVV